MRNPFPVLEVYERAYRETATMDAGIPKDVVPRLLPHARPVHELVTVDVFVPGCPPSADVIYATVTALLEGKHPDISAMTRFGA
jgi:NAD-reducing hydrogenase small subunit